MKLRDISCTNLKGIKINWLKIVKTKLDRDIYAINIETKRNINISYSVIYYDDILRIHAMFKKMKKLKKLNHYE